MISDYTQTTQTQAPVPLMDWIRAAAIRIEKQRAKWRTLKYRNWQRSIARHVDEKWRAHQSIALNLNETGWPDVRGQINRGMSKSMSIENVMSKRRI
jgi:hypothetical protein